MDSAEKGSEKESEQGNDKDSVESICGKASAQAVRLNSVQNECSAGELVTG